MRSVLWPVIQAPGWKRKLIQGRCVCACGCWGWGAGGCSCFQFPGPQIRWWLPYPSTPHSPDNQSLCKADHLTSGVLTEGYRNLQGPLNKNLNTETKAVSIKEPKDGLTLRPIPTSVWRNHTRAVCGGLVPWKRLKWSQMKWFPSLLSKSKTYPFCRENPLLQLSGFPQLNIM